MNVGICLLYEYVMKSYFTLCGLYRQNLSVCANKIDLNSSDACPCCSVSVCELREIWKRPGIITYGPGSEKSIRRVDQTLQIPQHLSTEFRPLGQLRTRVAQNSTPCKGDRRGPGNVGEGTDGGKVYYRRKRTWPKSTSNENGDGDAATLKKFYFMTYDINWFKKIDMVQCLFHRLVQSRRNHRIERDWCLWFL